MSRHVTVLLGELGRTLLRDQKPSHLGAVLCDFPERVHRAMDPSISKVGFSYKMGLLSRVDFRRMKAPI